MKVGGPKCMRSKRRRPKRWKERQGPLCTLMQNSSWNPFGPSCRENWFPCPSFGLLLFGLFLQFGLLLKVIIWVQNPTPNWVEGFLLPDIFQQRRTQKGGEFWNFLLIERRRICGNSQTDCYTQIGGRKLYSWEAEFLHSRGADYAEEQSRCNFQFKTKTGFCLFIMFWIDYCVFLSIMWN